MRMRPGVASLDVDGCSVHYVIARSRRFQQSMSAEISEPYRTDCAARFLMLMDLYEAWSAVAVTWHRHARQTQSGLGRERSASMLATVITNSPGRISSGRHGLLAQVKRCWSDKA